MSIRYNFWASRGKVDLVIENKLNKPIYIDWKKSNLIINGDPLPYWQDVADMETVTEGKSVGTGTVIGNIAIGGSNSSSTSQTKVTKAERITFLPPNALIEKETHRLLGSGEWFRMNKGIVPTQVPNDANPKKTTLVYSQKMNENESLVKFTNFITISMDESFSQEYFISNDFFISEIQEMELKHFRGKGVRQLNDSGVIEKVYPKKLKNQKRFYVYVPDGMEYRKRWKQKKVNLPKFLND